MKKKRNKKYIPNHKLNPVEFAKRLEILQDKIEKQKEQKDLVLKALENHFEYLVNFTSHDMKNCLQNLDSVVYNIDVNNFTQETLDIIDLCLKNIRNSLNEFNRLVPNSNKREFELFELCKAAEIINRNTFFEKEIKFVMDVDKKDKTIIKQPFHILLQVVNNLIINSIKALELSDVKERYISLTSKIIDNEVIIIISDNGIGIPIENKEKIFQMYFSTSGGSGVGLYHAKVSLEEISGNIFLSEKNDKFNTVFTIKFPVDNE